MYATKKRYFQGHTAPQQPVALMIMRYIATLFLKTKETNIAFAPDEHVARFNSELRSRRIYFTFRILAYSDGRIACVYFFDEFIVITNII